MSTSSETGQVDPQTQGTASLGWSPVRDVPDAFKTLVDQAEAAAVHWHLDENRGHLSRLTEYWDKITGDDNFRTTPITFQLDALNRRGIAHWYRGAAFRNDEELDIAENSFRRALLLMPDGWPDAWRYLNNLGGVTDKRYDHTGEMAQLEKSISFYLEAISSTLPDNPTLTQAYYNLSISLRHRYERLGTLDDLDNAIVYGHKVLEMAPPESYIMSTDLGQLGSAYRMRYLRTRDRQDIYMAIDLQEKSLQIKTTDATVPHRLTNLGNSLLELYYLEHEPDILSRAINAHQESLNRTQPEDPLLASRLNNLGNSLSQRYYDTDQLADLKAVIRLYEKAIDLTLSTDAELPTRHYNLANSLQALHYRTHLKRDRDRATENYRKACQTGMKYSLEWLLNASVIWGNWASDRKAWKEAEEAYSYGLRAIEQLYDSQIVSSHRETWLKSARDLAENAAYNMARLKKYQEAILILEQNRTRALNDTLGYDKIALRAVSDQDKTELLDIRARIKRLEAEIQSGVKSEPGNEINSEKLRQTREELTLILDRIHSYAPEFLARGLDYPETIALVNRLNKPLVYLLTTFCGSLALVITPTSAAVKKEKKWIHAIWIDEFTSQNLEFILFDQGNESHFLHGIALGETDTVKFVLQDIWPTLQSLMLPITQTVMEKGYDQAVMIPTGLLALLPMHAVMLDQVAFSYVPSARALKSVLLDEDHVHRSPALLSIVNPTSQKMAPLRFADIEAREVAALFETRKLQSGRLAGNQANLESIAKNVPGNTYLHFACHGKFDMFNPMDSMIYLTGEDALTLRGIIQQEIDVSGARLVTLSACQTGIVDFQNVPDEAVGFPGGLIQASVPAIISTLWPVDDVSTALLMIRFYRNHIERNLDPALALQEAQIWLRDSTAEQLGIASYYQRLADNDPYSFRAMRYYQKNPLVQPFIHPYYWAAFTFTGV